MGSFEMNRNVYFVAALFLAYPLAVIGCDIKQIEGQISSDGYDSVLKELSFADCLGDPVADKDNNLVSGINKITDGKRTAIPLFKATRDALDLVVRYAKDRADVGVQKEEWIAMSQELGHSNFLLSQITENTTEEDAQSIAKQALPLNKWQRIDGDTKGKIKLENIEVQLLAPLSCGAPNRCPAYESQREMVRVFNLVSRLQKYSQDGSLAKHYADAQLQTSRWEAYRSQGQHQYVWELWLNGLNMGQDLCPKDDTTGIQRGFCSVPETQWIVLHPEAGLRWSNAANQSSDLKLALVMEILGHSWWTWGKNQATMNDRWGVSWVAAYTDEPSGNKWSQGPMLHVGAGYNIAATYTSDKKWGLLLNLNLADRYFGGKQKVDSYLKCLNKPNPWQLLQGQDSCN
jgi:hypothetical protein